MSVFVTVGTTKFDELIKALFTTNVQKSLVEKGYSRWTLQIGNSREPDKAATRLRTDDIYRFKPSLAEDIESADLVIAHAGAGTCLEVLGAKKPLIVVINEELMGNHQTELAERLAQDNHLLHCTTSNLAECIQSLDVDQLVPFVKGDINLFKNHIDELMSS